MKEHKQKNLVYKFFIGFLIPYVLINGIIFVVYTAKPHINIISDNINTTDANVKFEIKSLLPLTKLSITKDELPIDYKKEGSTYIIPITSNGGIKIEATSINKITTPTYVEINTIDDIGPSINIEDNMLVIGTLTLTIDDNDSGINYDSIYGVINNEKIKPIFIDKSTGTIKFKIENNSSILIHVEDNIGNSSEKMIEAN